MTESIEPLERARELLSARREKDAIETLRETLHSTDDPHVIESVRALAAEAHEASHGFLKIEWQLLVFDADVRAGVPTG